MAHHDPNDLIADGLELLEALMVIRDETAAIINGGDCMQQLKSVYETANSAIVQYNGCAAAGDRGAA